MVTAAGYTQRQGFCSCDRLFKKSSWREGERRKERLGLTFIHGEGTFCHPRMQMAKMPTEEDGVRPLRGAEMNGWK